MDDYNINKKIYYANSSNNYNSINYSSQKKRSRCPLGAALGEIGSCCGLKCTRACAQDG